MATSFGTTASRLFVPGNEVLVVDDRNGNWAGKVILAGLFDTSPVFVAVLDPLDTRLVRGQWVVVPIAYVRSLRRSRWSR